MSLRHNVRHFANRFGIDITRYPIYCQEARTAKLITTHSVDCVVDVGANDGGFARAIRGVGYKGRIISFEPLQEPFLRLNARAKADPHWDAVRSAIGDSDSQVTINVSRNEGQSSSVLPMLPSHISAAPKAKYVGQETVNQRRLDTVLPELGLGLDTSSRVFLKVDVQGYEAAVLDGAAQLLASGAIVGLQLELSLVPLYDGAMTYRQAIDRAECLGMTLVGLDPVMADPKSGQLLQADAVFFHA